MSCDANYCKHRHSRAERQTKSHENVTVSVRRARGLITYRWRGVDWQLLSARTQKNSTEKDDYTADMSSIRAQRTDCACARAHCLQRWKKAFLLSTLSIWPLWGHTHAYNTYIGYILVHSCVYKHHIDLIFRLHEIVNLNIVLFNSLCITNN